MTRSGPLVRTLVACVLLAASGRARAAEPPASMLGIWDVSQEACVRSRAYSITRLGVARDRLRFHYGHADIVEIDVSRAEGRTPVAFLRANLFQEGQAQPGPDEAFYRLEHPGGTDTLRFTWKDVGPGELVRCAVRDDEAGGRTGTLGRRSAGRSRTGDVRLEAQRFEPSTLRTFDPSPRPPRSLTSRVRPSLARA